MAGIASLDNPASQWMGRTGSRTPLLLVRLVLRRNTKPRILGLATSFSSAGYVETGNATKWILDKMLKLL